MLFCASTFASKVAPLNKVPVLANPDFLKQAKLPILDLKEDVNVAYTELTSSEMERLSRVAHENKTCGGFQQLNEFQFPQQKLNAMREQNIKAQKFLQNPKKLALEKKANIEKAVSEVSETSLREFTTWFSSFPTRFNRNTNANTPVNALKDKIAALIAQSPHAWVKAKSSLRLISHRRTPQNSVNLRIEGSKTPSEIVVLGGHLDSISWGGAAPGADDNASGSSNVFEAAKILLAQPTPPERSIEFFWYAGEESGLLGSDEIAETYRVAGNDVVAVMQLDMTMFPGDGEGTLASMTDFTSPWLRAVIVELNSHYVGAKILDDKCGYGCSDHASWHSEGYPAVMPFEASFDTMNSKIHTAQDQVDGRSNFKHSALFGKLAVSYLMELGNSTLRQP